MKFGEKVHHVSGIYLLDFGISQSIRNLPTKSTLLKFVEMSTKTVKDIDYILMTNYQLLYLVLFFISFSFFFFKHIYNFLFILFPFIFFISFSFLTSLVFPVSKLDMGLWTCLGDLYINKKKKYFPRSVVKINKMAAQMHMIIGGKGVV